MTSFWAAHEAAEEMHAEQEREALRAEREADVLARIPAAPTLICCTLRFSPVECEPHQCDVLAALWGVT